MSVGIFTVLDKCGAIICYHLANLFGGNNRRMLLYRNKCCIVYFSISPNTPTYDPLHFSVLYAIFMVDKLNMCQDKGYGMEFFT